MSQLKDISDISEPILFEKEFNSFQEAKDFSSILNGYGYMTFLTRLNDDWVVKINIKDDEENYSAICALFYKDSNDPDSIDLDDLDFGLDDFEEEIENEECSYKDGSVTDAYDMDDFDYDDSYLGDGMYKDPQDPRNDWNR